MATLQAREEVWHVTCPHCLRFTLDPYLLNLFEAGRQHGDVRILRLLPRLSEAARDRAGEGSRLNLLAENWQAVASNTTALRHELKKGS
jgi:hypothetical protein